MNLLLDDIRSNNLPRLDIEGEMNLEVVLLHLLYIPYPVFSVMRLCSRRTDSYVCRLVRSDESLGSTQNLLTLLLMVEYSGSVKPSMCFERKEMVSVLHVINRV